MLDLREQRRDSLGLKDLGATFVYQVRATALVLPLTSRRTACSTSPGPELACALCAAVQLYVYIFARVISRQSGPASSYPTRAARSRRASSRSRLWASAAEQHRADALGGLASPTVSVHAPVQAVVSSTTAILSPR